jgi:hypothetical protein
VTNLTHEDVEIIDSALFLAYQRMLAASQSEDERVATCAIQALDEILSTRDRLRALDVSPVSSRSRKIGFTA